MPTSDSRAGQLNAVIDPKLLFLAKLASRYKAQSLNRFVEEALKLALSREAMLSDEPTPGHDIQVKHEEPLWFEALWDESDGDAMRLFRVGRSNLELLAPRQRQIYLHTINELTKQGKKVTPKNFVEFFKDGE
jgi:hypothetical protein